MLYKIIFQSLKKFLYLIGIFIMEMEHKKHFIKIKMSFLYQLINFKMVVFIRSLKMEILQKLVKIKVNDLM